VYTYISGGGLICIEINTDIKPPHRGGEPGERASGPSSQSGKGRTVTHRYTYILCIYIYRAKVICVERYRYEYSSPRWGARGERVRIRFSMWVNPIHPSVIIRGAKIYAYTSG